MAILKQVSLFTLVLTVFCLLYFVAPKKIPSKILEIIPPPNYPIRLIIPSINVNAQIQQLGVNLLGEMEVPTNIIDAGWFKLGPKPGDFGSAVIAGHLNGKNGKIGVFANLDKLKPGDKIMVEMNDHQTKTFTVDQIKIFNSGYAPEVFSSSDGNNLNLITCDGYWDKTKQSYSQRLVVFAH